MQHYCTLFDSHYLSRGLAMYDSLLQTGEYFTLYVFCFDEDSYQIIQQLNHAHLIPISLKEFETDALKKVKKERNIAEYCWTCTPFVIAHVLEHFDVNQITYIDADLLFFHPPSILLQEFSNSTDSVLINSHKYVPAYDQSRTSGIYCVEFITFKADVNGMKVLRWWQARCLEWCYDRLEDGKFGDQKYLDDWPERFEGVHVLEHIGTAAPWNIQQYELNKDMTVNNKPLVFYHYHSFKWLSENKFSMSNMYRISIQIMNLIYIPYINALQKQEIILKNHTNTSIIQRHFSKVDSAGRYNQYYLMQDQWIQNLHQNKLISDYLKQKNINNIAIYGTGKLAFNLYTELKASSITTVCFIDNSGDRDDMEGVISVSIHNKELLKTVDAIIITPIYDTINIFWEYFKDTELEQKFMSLEDLIFAL